MTTNIGMRGDGNWVTGQRPLNWRETILYLYPNGTAPLTAMLAKLASQRVDDPEFNWWTKTLPVQGGAITNIFTDVLSTAYTTGGSAGDTLYVQMAAAVIAEIRVGHQVLLRDASDLNVDVNAKVTARTVNAANSYITVVLLEDDDNSSNGDLSDADTVLVVGNINAEGAEMPQVVAYDPVKWSNYTQIFRTPLSLTRTALKTRLRTGDAYKEAKREALELHSIEMEKALLYGVASENTDATNSMPVRTTQGIIAATKAGGTTSDFVSASAYAGDAWLTSGEEWLDTQLEVIFRYGAGDKMAFIGSGTALAINNLAKTNGQIQLQPQTAQYGLKVMEWITPFGSVYMKTHPLFSYHATTRNAMLIFEPDKLKYRFIDDTNFIDQSGTTTKDAKEQEYLTEMGLEYHHPAGWGWLTGFGQLNTAT